MPHLNPTRKFNFVASNSYTFSGSVWHRFVVKVKAAPQIMRAMPAKNGHSADFERLGRASVIIVHDIKNQLNGLKLYATFLRKRLDRDERPQDEREIMAKLIAGLDRAANDLTAIVRYAQPQDLKCQKRVDLLRLISKALDEPTIEPSFKEDFTAIAATHPESMHGDFDSSALTTAIKAFAERASAVSNTHPSRLALDRVNDSHEARIEWRINFPVNTQDPFTLPKEFLSCVLPLPPETMQPPGEALNHMPTGLRVWVPLIE